jgi:hypothetical protein
MMDIIENTYQPQFGPPTSEAQTEMPSLKALEAAL